MKSYKMNTNEMEIPTSVTTDDNAWRFSFDAEPWFIDASDDAIKKLFLEGLTDSYATDGVAYFCAEKNKYLESMFVYLEHLKELHPHSESGFCVRINRTDALKWVNEHRPSIYDDCIFCH